MDVSELVRVLGMPWFFPVVMGGSGPQTDDAIGPFFVFPPQVFDFWARDNPLIYIQTAVFHES